MQTKKLAILSAFLLLLSACSGGATVGDDGTVYVEGEKRDSFRKPDIKNDFCGVHINFQYCKCAFHNEYCNAIGMDKAAANTHVYAKFDEYVAGLMQKYTEGCTAAKGYVEGDSCYLCPEGAEPEEGKCVEVNVQQETEGTDETEESEEMSDACDDIEENWEKYSDIDWRIPMEERSFEAKEYARVQDAIVAMYAEQAELVYETDLLRQKLADVREYKAALVDNLRDNLVKATLRLTYITYSQIDGAKGAGQSFSKLLTGAESLEALGAGMKSIQAVIPKESRLEIDTNSVSGKVKSIGWNATLEAIESMGDPSAIAQQVMKDAKGAVVPGADITPEEVEILRKQNLENNLLNDVIAELESEIAENEAWLTVADVRIPQLEAESDTWLAKEKKRTLLLLEDECKLQ